MQSVALVYLKYDDDSYNRQLQLNKIKESIIPDYDYEIEYEDDLREAFDTALSRNVDSITTILPEKLIESRILQEYKDKFENFDIIKETFYRLDEADNTQAQQTNPQNVKPQEIPATSSILIWPINPPFVTNVSKANFNAIKNHLGNGKMFNDSNIFIYIPNNGVNGEWCLTAPNCCARISIFSELASLLSFSNYKVITSIRTFKQNIQQSSLGNLSLGTSNSVSTNAAIDASSLNNFNQIVIYCQPKYAKAFKEQGFNVQTNIDGVQLQDEDLTNAKLIYQSWVNFNKKHKLSKFGDKAAIAGSRENKIEPKSGGNNVRAAKTESFKLELFDKILREANVGEAEPESDTSKNSAWDWERVKSNKGAMWFLNEILSNITTCAKGLGESVLDASKVSGLLKGIRDQYAKELADIASEAGNLAARSLGLGFVADFVAKASKAYTEKSKDSRSSEVSAIGAYIKSKDSEVLRNSLSEPEEYIEKAGEQ